MKLQQLSLPIKNNILKQYWNNDASVTPFFDYRVEDDSYKKRLAYLQTKTYKRAQLANVIEQYMARFGLTKEVEQSLKELREEAVVVVGGQQAGVLTGPLYSVHKAISVIVLAKQQQEKLNHPVVPLFWIAGEDHDLEEINHTFTLVNGEVKKRGYGERSKRKTMASTTELNKAEMEKLVRTIFADYGETHHTASLLADAMAAVEEANTFTDFFTILMSQLFNKHGLLMVDAAFAPFRTLQSDYFVSLVEQNEQIANVVVKTEAQFEAQGFGKPIEATETNANLFYVKDGERFLLSRNEAGDKFSNATANVHLTYDELLQTAKQSPERLSNNVVTRPIMQEMSMPVLAFVGGPGELAYWATLKEAFHLLDLQMPIFAPRMNITIVSREVQPLLDGLSLSFEDVYNERVQQLKEQFIASIQSDEVTAQMASMTEQLQAQYMVLREQLEMLSLSMEKLVVKNEQFHLNQLQFLQQKIEQQLLVKHDVKIRQFMTIENELLPQGGFQERLYNPYKYMNVYGPTFVDDLLAQSYVLDASHKVITI